LALRFISTHPEFLLILNDGSSILQLPFKSLVNLLVLVGHTLVAESHCRRDQSHNQNYELLLLLVQSSKGAEAFAIDSVVVQPELKTFSVAGALNFDGCRSVIVLTELGQY
jgi:hypothetical protein